MASYRCLGQTVDFTEFSSTSHRYLRSFPNSISVYELWDEMDRVWDETLKSHFALSNSFFTAFYSHPVWSLNSIFTRYDNYSSNQRLSLVHSIFSLPINSIVDMGGGFGVLCRLLKSHNSESIIYLCEPYSNSTTKRTLAFSGVNVVDQTPANCDCYIFIDVLEHCLNPIKYLFDSINRAKPNSYFYLGNCFYPVIKCHLKSTFYLRYTFDFAAFMLGLKCKGRVAGARYIKIYQICRRPLFPVRRIIFFTKLLFVMFYPFHVTMSAIVNSYRAVKRFANYHKN